MIRRICTILVVCTFSVLTAAAAADQPAKTLHVAFCFGPGKKPLTDFQKYLETNYRVSCVTIEAEKSKNEKETPFTNIDALAKCEMVTRAIFWAADVAPRAFRK